MPASIKALALVAMGLFLYSRYLTGSLLFYINERFVWLTVLASIGFVLVGLSYRYRAQHNHHHHDHDGHDPSHQHDDHDHGDHQHSQLTWAGLLLVVSPIVLGLLIPPKPLGAAAMSNRDLSVKSLTSVAAPESAVISKPKADKNILDWLIEFQSAGSPEALAGEEAKVIGFIYRDERFAPNEFMVSRFTISCCAADAAPLGLLVRAPEAVTLPDDAWVEVRGQFETGQLDGEPVPVIAAAEITPTDVPEQPYLYPY
ncbi:MAG: hypothetical protein Kow0031_38160 [Anaerolineae bacterium]